jgi:ComEC/Rec2-related protein
MPLYLPRALALAAALAWIGTFAAFSEHGQLYVLGSTLLVVALIKYSDAKPACWFMLILPAAFYLCGHLRKPSADHLDLCRFTGSFTVFQAEILEIVEQPQFQRNILIVRPFQLCYPREGPLAGKSEVIVKGAGLPKLSIGTYIEVKGRIIEPEDSDVPWRFKQRTRLAQTSIFCFAIAHSAGISLLPGKDSYKSTLANWISSSRQCITDLHLSALGKTYGPLLESIVLGNRCVELPSDLVDKYRKVGLSHLLAASGFNLTIVIVVTHFAAKSLTRSKTLHSLSALLPMTIFVLLAGLSPSVVRAAACSLIILLAIQSGRSLNPAAVLSLVLVTVLAIEPISALDVGAQLSYAATFGILHGARPLADLFGEPLTMLGGHRAKDGRTNRGLTLTRSQRILAAFVRWTTEAIAVVLSAQAAVLPIQLAYFWRLGTMFLPASVLVDPLVAPITVIGFASSSLILTWSALQGVCKQLDYVALVPLKALDSIASFFAALEGTYVNFGPPLPVSIIIYYLALASFCISLIARRSRLYAATLLIAASFALLWRPALARPMVSIAPNSLTFIGTDRKAIAFGEESSSATKFLAYNGAQLTNRISGAQVSHGPNKFSLTSGANQLRFIVFDCNQITHFPDAQPSDGTTTSVDSPVILAVYNGNIANVAVRPSNQTLRTYQKRSGISATSLDQLQHRYAADYILLIQRHFSRGKKQSRGHTKLSASSSPDIHQPEKPELAISLYCERGIQAQLFKRKAERSETN